MGFMIIVLIISIVFMVIQINNASAESKRKKTNQKVEELKSLANYDYGGTLKVYKRSPELASVLAIADDQNIVTAYNPEKLHVGAVSVGGVVSGGAYTTGGNHYVAHSEKSGKSIIVFGGDKKIIKKIWLTSELFVQAEKSSIAQYLDKAKQQINVIDDVYLSEFDIMWKKANVQAGNLGMTDAEKAGYPSYEKCKAILDWLCSTRNPDVEDYEKKSDVPEKQNSVTDKAVESNTGNNYVRSSTPYSAVSNDATDDSEEKPIWVIMKTQISEKHLEKLKKYEGEAFQTKKGNPFTYRVREKDNAVSIHDATGHYRCTVWFYEIEHGFTIKEDSVSAFRNFCSNPTYVYAIVHDKRILSD